MANPACNTVDGVFDRVNLLCGRSVWGLWGEIDEFYTVDASGRWLDVVDF